MRPPEGKHFDLQSVDDGRPAVSVRQKGGLAGRVILFIAVIVAAAVGFGFGASAVGRRMFNQANFGAKRVKAEMDDMQKTITEITTYVNMSSQRLAATKQEPLAFDYKLVEDLEKVKLDPRPDTSRIFKVNYYLLEDLAIDRLMNYYYDTIILFGEVERHIKRTKADKSVLEAFAAKQAAKGGEDASKQVNYGVVFDSRGKLAIASLVEVGKPVCKGGAENCGSSDVEGFMIRSNTGANWSPRKVGPKPEGDKVVPIEKTPLFEAVMSGSPDQVRMEQYKQRYNNIRLILQRLASTKKELGDAIDKAAAGPICLRCSSSAAKRTRSLAHTPTSVWVRGSVSVSDERAAGSGLRERPAARSPHTVDRTRTRSRPRPRGPLPATRSPAQPNPTRRRRDPLPTCRRNDRSRAAA
jgi:hypothetical protein